jgi:hypothetical protein
MPARASRFTPSLVVAPKGEDPTEEREIDCLERAVAQENADAA